MSSRATPALASRANESGMKSPLVALPRSIRSRKGKGEGAVRNHVPKEVWRCCGFLVAIGSPPPSLPHQGGGEDRERLSGFVSARGRRRRRSPRVALPLPWGRGKPLPRFIRSRKGRVRVGPEGDAQWHRRLQIEPLPERRAHRSSRTEAPRILSLEANDRALHHVVCVPALGVDSRRFRSQFVRRAKGSPRCMGR